MQGACQQHWFAAKPRWGQAPQTPSIAIAPTRAIKRYAGTLQTVE